MPMDEVIRAIERADVEDIQDVVQAVIGRYRELYPQWEMLFLSADTNATDERSLKILEWIRKADSFVL